MRSHPLAILLLVACAPPPAANTVVESASTATDDVLVVFDGDDGVARSEWMTVEHRASADRFYSSGAERLLVMRLEFSGGAPECSEAETTEVMFGPGSVAEHVALVTSGRRTLSGDVVGPIAVERRTGCAVTDWASEALAAVEKAGVDPSDYDRWMFMFPGAPCSFAGLAEIHGPRSWIHGSACRRRPVVLHELGHNFGLHHASTANNTYGDLSDPMGNASGLMRGFHAPHSIALGLVDPGDVAHVDGDYYGPIAPLVGARFSRAPKSLEIGTPRDSHRLLISYRAPAGWDATLAGAYVDRLSVHEVLAGSGVAPTILLATVAPHSTFVDAARGLTITARPHIGGEMFVDLAIECRPGTLTLGALEPLWIRPGGRAERIVVVQNFDGAGCASRTVDVDALSTSAAISVEADDVVVAPGEDAATSFRVVVGPAVPSGFQRVFLSADEARGQLDVYVDGTPPTTPMSIVAEASLRPPGTVRLDWPPSTDDGPDVRYVVFRDGAPVIVTEFSDPGRPVRVTDKNVPHGFRTYTIVAEDRAGNASPPSAPVVVVVR